MTSTRQIHRGVRDILVEYLVFQVFSLIVFLSCSFIFLCICRRGLLSVVEPYIYIYIYMYSVYSSLAHALGCFFLHCFLGVLVCFFLISVCVRQPPRTKHYGAQTRQTPTARFAHPLLSRGPSTVQLLPERTNTDYLFDRRLVTVVAVVLASSDWKSWNLHVHIRPYIQLYPAVDTIC